jgi:hypothetical protein
VCDPLGEGLGEGDRLPPWPDPWLDREVPLSSPESGLDEGRGRWVAEAPARGADPCDTRDAPPFLVLEGRAPVEVTDVAGCRAVVAPVPAGVEVTDLAESSTVSGTSDTEGPGVGPSVTAPPVRAASGDPDGLAAGR